MVQDVLINPIIADHEVPDLRAAVGWGRRDGDYPTLFSKCLFWAGVRDPDGRLIAFGYVTGPGIEHGYLEDVMVHPDHQRTGWGMAVVRSLLAEAERQGVSIVTVTYQRKHQAFYERCGFTPCPGGVWERAKESGS